MVPLISFLFSRLTHVWLPVLFGDRDRIGQEQFDGAEDFPDTREW